MRIWSGPAGDVRQAGVVELGQLHQQILGHVEQGVVGIAGGGLLLRRERQGHDGDVVDAAPDDQRLGNAERNAVQVGPHFFMHAQDGVVGAGADKETRCNQHVVVFGVGIDMLDAVDGLDDGLQRLGDEFHRILGLEPVGAHGDVHHRHGNLRLLLARQGQRRDDAQREGGQQHERCQRRADEGAGQPPGDAKFGIAVHGRISRSPDLRPERISMPSDAPSSAAARPGCTTTSTGAPSVPATFI